MSGKNTSAAVISVAALIRERANSIISRELKTSGVNDLIPAHGLVLETLKRHGRMTMGDLAESTRRKKSTLTTLVQTLKKNGYLKCVASSDDARVQNVSLTRKGEEMHVLQIKISERLLAALWQGIAPADRLACMRVMWKMADNLNSADENIQLNEGHENE